jgi:hypothetical protein
MLTVVLINYMAEVSQQWTQGLNNTRKISERGEDVVLQKVLINPDVSVAICKVAPMLAVSAALYLTLFVVETNPRLGTSLPAFDDPPKLNWWRKLLSTKTSVLEAGHFVRNRQARKMQSLQLFDNY